MTDVMAAVNISMFDEILVGRLPGFFVYQDAVNFLLGKPKNVPIKDPEGITRYVNFDHVTMVELDRTEHPGLGGIIGVSRMKLKANIMGGGLLEGDLRGHHSKKAVDEFFKGQPPVFEMVKDGTENSVIVNFDHCVFVELCGSIIKG